VSATTAGERTLESALAAAAHGMRLQHAMSHASRLAAAAAQAQIEAKDEEDALALLLAA